jgi:putative transposase
MELDKKEFDPVSKRGNSHKHSKRTIVNAILYVVKGGIQWRLMPNDFPPWQTVYDHFGMIAGGTSGVSGRNAWIN